jgi:signal transduction histidine kinase
VPRNLHAAASANVFRIAQEAVTNALRHSRAKRIEMVLHFSSSSLRLCVRDDGGGSGAFRRDDVAAAGKQGIAGMYERAAKLDAVLHTRPNGRGIEVVLEVPL